MRQILVYQVLAGAMEKQHWGKGTKSTRVGRGQQDGHVMRREGESLSQKGKMVPRRKGAQQP